MRRAVVIAVLLALAAPLPAADPERAQYFLAMSVPDENDRFDAMAAYLEKFPKGEWSDQIRAHLLTLAVGESQVSGSILEDVPNLILTPHIAGVTLEANDRVGAFVAEQVRRALSGGT